MALNLRPAGDFADRHLGPRASDIQDMLAYVGAPSLEALVADTVPESIRLSHGLRGMEAPLQEHELLQRLREVAGQNRVFRSWIGMGYHGTLTPGVIQRNILENPGWYTQYTPYQAEIAQGRLEALLNFQTMVIDLTGLEIANASLLDEATAAAEAMTLAYAEGPSGRNTFQVAHDCHPQTIAVVRSRAEPLGIQVELFAPGMDPISGDAFGILLQYPATDGAVHDPRPVIRAAKEAGAVVVMAADLLSLTLLVPPGELGADLAVGNTQRFGVPMGYGGPHAAYLAARDSFKRRMPGRIIGVSVDADGRPALRMALQTREQHIRREKATSNICTSQVLLAVMAGMYAVYHGPEGLRSIARRIHDLATALARGAEALGHHVVHEHFFDTLRIRTGPCSSAYLLEQALAQRINLRDYQDGSVGIALDETTTAADVDELLALLAQGGRAAGVATSSLAAGHDPAPFPAGLSRTSAFLEHPVFHRHHSETDLLRYIHRLQAKDLSLTTSMIPLGSCTMKLNGTTEMTPVTWPEFGALHPFAPRDQAQGYARIFSDLERWLGEICGLPAVSLQPNSGAQGEYAGLLVIRAYHLDRGDKDRRICLIPASAHGTNPASAVMAGMEVQVVGTDGDGNIDIDDLRAKALAAGPRLAACMITYPSTHGVFEAGIREICDLIHAQGGMVYMDGANLNAQVGVCRPGDMGADVCHVNLHKTFAIPHGGGGPGMGPICATPALAPFLPGHPVVSGVGGERAMGPVSAAPWGSASILLISWAYIALLGPEGLTRATQVAILNANYMARRLESDFDVLFRGRSGRVAHEFILDLRPFRKSAGITEEDVAKRLMDYGYHAPTMSWPVPGTIMIEPTESESRAELDRFCDALISIRDEIRQVELGIMDATDNPLRNAPHTAASVTAEEWSHPYTRAQAAWPASWTREHKFWPTVRRVDNARGDRNLVCACPPMEAYAGGS
jgi:glycine dehydrogenase